MQVNETIRAYDLAEALRGDPPETSPDQGQPSWQDDPVHDEHGVPHGSPDSSTTLIRAGRAFPAFQST